MLSTTSKSWSSTSLSGFWLKLPTVWVMPSWMAPLRAEDVVWGSQAEKKCFVIHSKTVSPDPRSIMGQHWKTPTFLYVVSPVGSIPRCPIVFFIFWDILVLGPWQEKPKKTIVEVEITGQKKEKFDLFTFKRGRDKPGVSGSFQNPLRKWQRTERQCFLWRNHFSYLSSNIFSSLGGIWNGGRKISKKFTLAKKKKRQN